MIGLIVMSTALITMLCVLAYMLATYALPFTLAFGAACFSFDTGAGLVGACIVGVFTGVASFGLLTFLFATLRAPILRIAVALIFAVPAAVAGYAFVHGVTSETAPSGVWRQIFCIAGAIGVGGSALSRLADPTLFGEHR
jgi:hypothetical protein